MIKETTYYEVVCDKCGERLEIDGVTAWQSEEEAEDALNYADWQETDTERVYCNACLEAGEIELDNASEEDYD